MTEAELIAAAVAGDEDAATAIFKQYQRIVLGVAKSIFRKEQDRAEDIAQEVWLKVFKGLVGFEGGSKLSTWIVRITVNECFIALRAAKTGMRRQECEVYLDAPGTHKDEEILTEWLGAPDPAVAQFEAQLDLAKMFRGMAAADRQILTLRFLEELSEQETAAAMGLSLAESKSKFWQAKRRARSRNGSPSRFLAVAF